MPITTAQISVASTATALAAASGAGKRVVTVKNTHATETFFIGAAAVTAITGLEVKAGQSVTLETKDALYGITTSGTSTAHVLIAT